MLSLERIFTTPEVCEYFMGANVVLAAIFPDGSIEYAPL